MTDKLEMQVFAKDLKRGDVLSAKNKSKWEYGATVGEAQRDNDGPVLVSDINGYPLADGRPLRPNETVWVERMDHTWNMVQALKAHAPDHDAEELVESIFQPLFEAGVRDDRIQLMVVNMLGDGLRWGNWIWIMNDAERAIRP